MEQKMARAFESPSPEQEGNTNISTYSGVKLGTNFQSVPNWTI